MKLDYHPEDTSKNHYTAIVIDEDASIPTAQEEMNTEEVCQNMKHAVHIEPIQIDDSGHERNNFDDIPDVSFEMPAPSQPNKSGRTRKTRGQNCLDMSAFRDVPVEVMSKIPWDIDGTWIISVPGEEDFWIETAADGRWWKTVQSSRKDLNGEHKFFLYVQDLLFETTQHVAKWHQKVWRIK